MAAECVLGILESDSIGKHADTGHEFLLHTRMFVFASGGWSAPDVLAEEPV